MTDHFSPISVNNRQVLEDDTLGYMSPLSAFTRRPDYVKWVRSNSKEAPIPQNPPLYQNVYQPFSDPTLDRSFASDFLADLTCSDQFPNFQYPDLKPCSCGGSAANYISNQNLPPDFQPYSNPLFVQTAQPSIPTQRCTVQEIVPKQPVTPPRKETNSQTQTDKASRKTTPHRLPACKVCGSQATGFHYGVNSCEACKGFFHRSLQRRKPYKCFGSAKCEILPGKRNVCGRCRYQRCLDVGMSKEGIKTGRYTYEKRTKDILELQQTNPEDMLLPENPPLQPEVVERDPEIEAFVFRLVEEKEKLLSDVQLVDKSVSGITIRHQEAPDKLMYVPFEPPDQNEDGGKLWRKWASVMENTGGVRRVIKFVKTIPGFRELEIADQIQLIKHSFIEIWLVARHKQFDVEGEKFNNRVGFSFDIIKAFGPDGGYTLLRVSRRLKCMALSEEETALMLAVVTFFSDRCQQLIDSRKVDKIQDNNMRALRYVLLTQNPGDRTRFYNIMSIFTDLRNVTEMYHHTLSNRLLSNIGDIAPLLWEIVNL